MGMLGVNALNYFTWLVMLRLAQAGSRTCRRYVRNTLRNWFVKWISAMLTHLPVLPFQIFIVSNVRGHAMSSLLNARVTLLR